MLLPVLIEPVQPPWVSAACTQPIWWAGWPAPTTLFCTNCWTICRHCAKVARSGLPPPPAKARATGFRTRRRLWTGVAALVATSSTAGWFAWRHFSAPDTVKPFAEIAMVDCTVVGPGRYEVFARGSVSGSPGMIASAEARPGPHPLTLDCHPWPPESALFPGHCRRYGELANEPAFKGRSLWGTRTTIQADEPPTSLVSARSDRRTWPVVSRHGESVARMPRTRAGRSAASIGTQGSSFVTLIQSRLTPRARASATAHAPGLCYKDGSDRTFADSLREQWSQALPLPHPNPREGIGRAEEQGKPMGSGLAVLHPPPVGARRVWTATWSSALHDSQLALRNNRHWCAGRFETLRSVPAVRPRLSILKSGCGSGPGTHPPALRDRQRARWTGRMSESHRGGDDEQDHAPHRAGFRLRSCGLRAFTLQPALWRRCGQCEG